MAVGHKWAHAKLLREGECLAVVALDLLDLGRFNGSGDLAVEPERPRFIASLLVLPKPIQSPLGELSRDVSAPSNQIRFG